MMTLATTPLNVACRIEAIGAAVRDLGRYVSAGVREGVHARVLARYPEGSPRFVELEVGDHIVLTLPMPVAAQVSVSPSCVGG